jgi:hypothetical protein
MYRKLLNPDVSDCVQVPHVAVVGLVVRDLLVCLIVLPAALGKKNVLAYYLIYKSSLELSSYLGVEFLYPEFARSCYLPMSCIVNVGDVNFESKC